MSNKKQLFESMGGNSFRIATPQAMGMMGEAGFSSGQSRGMAPSNEPSDRPPLGNTPKMQDKVRLTIARKSDTNEWLVKVYVNGKYSEDKTYYTDDKQDAIDTAKAMMGDFQKKGVVLVGKDGQPVAPVGEAKGDPNDIETWITPPTHKVNTSVSVRQDELPGSDDRKTDSDTEPDCDGLDESRCEDYPCCGHEAGDCPDSEGRFTCVGCGKRLPRDAGSSICPKCQSRMSRDDYEDPTGQDY